MNRSLTSGAVLCCAALGLTAATAITITPSSHHFGQVAAFPPGIIRASGPWHHFVARWPSGVTPGNIARVTITGVNASDFSVKAGRNPTQFPTSFPIQNCLSGPQGIGCSVPVTFEPTGLGLRTATLTVVDDRGNTGTADLEGEGVGGICEMRVVSCNYAQLYGGTFNWNSTVTGPAGQSHITVGVNVSQGQATCAVSEVDVSSTGRRRAGSVQGPGLIGVEFLSDPVLAQAYRIVVACPTPNWPATVDEPATPSEPAELGNGYTMESDKQRVPVSAIATRGSATALIAHPDLSGSLSYPAPETDAANGVSGTVVVTWDLKRWCQGPAQGCPP